jgi:predicted ATP-grasp superfamily ATP-dependent carboligase
MRERGRPPALIIGAGYTALSAARSLGHAGVPVLVAAPSADFASRSRFVRDVVGTVETGEPAPILEAVRHFGRERVVLFPCSDLSCEAVASLPPESGGRLSASIPSQETADLLLDKARLAELLRSNEVPHPRTVDMVRADDLEVMAERPGATWLLKPRSSQRFYQVFSQKAFVVHDRAEAGERLADCVEAGLSMVLQEYIQGPPTAHVFVDGFVDRGGVVRARLARRRLRRYPHDLGNSSSGFSIPLAELETTVPALDALLASLRYRGIFSAEFKHDATDGEYKLLEVNCRPYWFVDFARQCGINLCLMAYRDALGEAVQTETDYRVGVPFGFASIETKALFDEYRRGQLSKPALTVGLARLPRLCPNVADPLPALVRLAGIVRRKLPGP